MDNKINTNISDLDKRNEQKDKSPIEDTKIETHWLHTQESHTQAKLEP